MSNISKEHAIELFLWLVKAIYTNHRKLRTYVDARTMDAFHVVYMRLNEIGQEFAESEKYLGLSFHPWYPVIKDKNGRYYISHFYFHKWVDSFIPVLRRVEVLRALVELHQNERDYEQAVRESWEQFEEPITYEENASYAEYVQEQWEKLQSKQLKLFPYSDLEIEKPHPSTLGAFD